MDPFDLAREDVDFERLAAHLKALAHPGRLEILWRLRIPATSAEVVVKPTRRDADLPQERPMSRQSVDAHLATLEEAGVVNRVADEDDASGQWVTSNQRLFALIEELRKLTAIRPAARVDVDATMGEADALDLTWTPGPKLVLVSGPWEGRAFPLDGAGPWAVGRSRSLPVSLSYDPFVSAEHARVLLKNGAFALEGVAGARNPVRVNFAPLRLGTPRPLAPGDILGVGRSLLVFREK